MSTFPRSPRLLKGGLVLLDPSTAAVLRIIVLQYNSDSLSRTLQVQATGGEGSGRSEAAQGAAGGGGEVRVRLHPEHLVLEGSDLAPPGRPLLEAALEAELGRLLAEGGVSPDLRGGIAVPAVKAAGFELSDDRRAAGLGAQIARSVYGGIGE